MLAVRLGNYADTKPPYLGSKLDAEQRDGCESWRLMSAPIEMRLLF